MIHRIRYELTAILTLHVMVAAAQALPEQQFAEAQALFDDAKKQLESSEGNSAEVHRYFYESATHFVNLAQEGTVSLNLYVNAGNAYHFAGDNPRALLWYLRAAQLANTPETRAGLAGLRRVCKAELWPSPRASIMRVLFFWHYDLNRRVKQGLLLAIYPVGCVLVMVSFLVKRRSFWRRLGITLIVVGGIIGTSDLITAMVTVERWAVVLETVDGYAGDGKGYSVVANSIPPGQEVKVLESRRQWMQVELPSSTQCWVRNETCEEVRLQ